MYSCAFIAQSSCTTIPQIPHSIPPSKLRLVQDERVQFTQTGQVRQLLQLDSLPVLGVPQSIAQSAVRWLLRSTWVTSCCTRHRLRVRRQSVTWLPSLLDRSSLTAGLQSRLLSRSISTTLDCPATALDDTRIQVVPELPFFYRLDLGRIAIGRIAMDPNQSRAHFPSWIP